jgi:hypothetical protein
MPDSRPPEMLEAGAVYTSAEFVRRLRFGQSGWRKLKLEGLTTHKLGKTVVVLADDFTEFLRNRDK